MAEPIITPSPGPKWVCHFCGQRLRADSERMIQTCWKCEHETPRTEGDDVCGEFGGTLTPPTESDDFDDETPCPRCGERRPHTMSVDYCHPPSE